MKKNSIFATAAMFVLAAALSSCGKTGNAGASASSSKNAKAAETQENLSESADSARDTADAKRLSIVCTNFPEYDFARQIVGDRADVMMLLKPGAESHTYEPSPEDIVTIQDSDMFVYVGGDSDAWVDGVLDAMDQSHMTVFKLMDQVPTVEEETVEGMEAEEDDEEEGDGPEMDEHVWTSPKNAMVIVEKMADTIEDLDTGNRETYQKNAESYIGEIRKLDDQFKDVIDHGRRKEIIVADRFPFRYFCEEFGLTYYAAFPGCSTDTQPSAKTVAFLTDKIKEDQIPVVFHIELSNEQMADSIADVTGAKAELLNAVHNVSDEDFRNGATYVSLMQHNVEALKEALN